jgi:DNA-binding beta-propeller fold protein YncE
VANLNSTPNSVVEYSPPFAGGSAPIATITDGVNEQGAIGLNGSANLFVPNQGANTVTEYVAPYANPPATIVGGQSQPVALAIDALGNLYVANYGNNTVTVYVPPYASGSWTTLGNGISLPLALALSPATNAATAVIP